MVKTASFLVVFLTALAAWSLPSEAEVRQRLVDLALSLQGTPYVYGAESPRGFDCSGFVQYLYAQAACLEVPRTSRSQCAQGGVVELSDAQPGDVLVYGTAPGVVTHVAIYLGNGALVHAASRGPQRGIVVAQLTDRYFESHFLGVRSFLPPPTAAVAPGETPVVLRYPVVPPSGTTAGSRAVPWGAPVVVALANTGEPTTVTVTVAPEGEAQAPLVHREVALEAHQIVALEAFLPPEPGFYQTTLLVNDGPEVVALWRVVQRWGS